MNYSELCTRYNNGEIFKYKFFWQGQLSNWYESDFIVDGIRYWCNEQYMMAQKVALFGDTYTFNKIMSSNDQREIKKLGRTGQGFVQKVWDKNKERIVFDGCYAKFTQDTELLNYLLSLRDYVLVEASPYDPIWGIGLGQHDHSSLLTNPNNWRGLNLLGFVLMDVRDTIMKRGN